LVQYALIFDVLKGWYILIR